MKQGAVSWLAEQIEKHTWYDEEGFAYVKVSSLDIEKAKQMEKQQGYTEEDMVNFAFDTYYYISKLMEVPFNQISENKLHAIENLKKFKNKSHGKTNN